MSLDPISAGLDLATAIVGLFPNKNAQEQAELKIEIQNLIDSTQLATAQINVNQAEAENESVFIAGWRPFIGWVCGAAFVWQFIILQIVAFIGANVKGSPMILPVFDTTTMISILGGLLGLGAMRSYDKVTKSKSSN